MLPKVNIYEMNDGVRYMLFEEADQRGVSGMLKQNKVYEPNLFIVSEAILRQASIDRTLVLDIGANLGSYVVPIARRFNNMSFLCFEPQPHVYQQLCGNLFLNSLDNVSAKNMALGRKAGNLTLTLPDYSLDHNIGAFTVKEEIHANLRGEANKGECVTVPINHLDYLNLEEIALIKLDVEGSELDVLHGGVGTLARNLFPPIIYEAWDLDWYRKEKLALESFLKDLGYSISNFDGSDNYLAQHPNHGTGIGFQS